MGGGAQPQARALPTASAAAAAAAAAAAELDMPGQSPLAPQATNSIEAPAEQEELAHSPPGSGGLAHLAVAAAAEETAATAAAGAPPAVAGGGNAMGRPQSLMACWDSLQPAAKTIVRAAQAGWLGTDQIYQLMANYKTVGVPLIAMHPFRPKAGDVFLADRNMVFGKRDRHKWHNPRHAKLKVDGKDVLKVRYWTTHDGKLQRRTYHFLEGCEPELANVYLLTYQKPESELNATENSSLEGASSPQAQQAQQQQAQQQQQQQQPSCPDATQATAAEATAAAAAAAQAETAAATRSPEARLAQQRAGPAEQMYTGGYSMPDLDGKQHPHKQEAAADAGAADELGEWAESEELDIGVGGRPAAHPAQPSAAERAAAEAERQRQAAAEDERQRQAAAEAEWQQQRQAASAEAERQTSWAKQQAAEAQQAQHPGQKREREEAADEGGEAPRGAKRQATVGQSPAAEPEVREPAQQQQEVRQEEQAAAQQEQAAAKHAPGAGGSVGRLAARRVALPILKRAGIAGTTQIAFLNEFLKKESDAGEVQFAVELLQDLDAAGDTEGVRALVESYLPK